MNPREIVDFAQNDDANELRKALYANIYDRVAQHLEAKKQEIARNLVGQQEVETPAEEAVVGESMEYTIPAADHFAANKKKVQAAHKTLQDKGFKYSGSEEKDTHMGGRQVTHHYLGHGHTLHMHYDAADMHKEKGPKFTMSKTAHQNPVHHHLAEEAELHEHLMTEEQLDEAAFEGIKKGAFHRWLGKSENQSITTADIKKGLAAGGHAARMANFAKNAKHHFEEVDLEEAVSRKHFQMVADTLKEIPDMKKRQEMANHHAAIFAKQNPRFDHGRFHAASGTKHGE